MRASKVVQLDVPAQWVTVPEAAVRLRLGQATLWRMIAKGPEHGGIRSILAANPPPAPGSRRPHQRGRLKQSPTRNLLERLWLDQAAVLAFLDDLAIPFDNNQAERDLRMLKVQQKVSGCFRSIRGGTAFGRIRGYLSSLSKQGVMRLAALETVFIGQPLCPGFG